MLCTVAECIVKRRANLVKTIEGRRILEECRAPVRRQGTPAHTYWWEQELTLEEDGQDGGEDLGFIMNSRDGSNAWIGGGSQCSDTFGDYSSRVRRQQAEELEIVMEEAKEVEAPLPPRHHRTGVGEEAPEVEDRAEREEEERRPR